MKKANEVAKFLFADLRNKQSLINMLKIFNQKYVCGELYKNLLLNPDQKSSFLYYELTENEIILGFKNANNELYQNLLRVKDASIFGETNANEDLSYLIKDIKNYSYIQGGAMITFHKQLLIDFLKQKLKILDEKPMNHSIEPTMNSKSIEQDKKIL